jgi:hypothetical protein
VRDRDRVGLGQERIELRRTLKLGKLVIAADMGPLMKICGTARRPKAREIIS